MSPVRQSELTPALPHTYREGRRGSIAKVNRATDQYHHHHNLWGQYAVHDGASHCPRTAANCCEDNTQQCQAEGSQPGIAIGRSSPLKAVPRAAVYAQRMREIAQ